MIGQTLMYLAALAGMASGILWWRAATVVVHEGDTNSKGAFIVNGIDVQSTLNEQRKSYAVAALATGVTMLLSGLVPILMRLP
jgi:hypothetical protein